MTELQPYQSQTIVDASSYGRVDGAVAAIEGLPPAAQALGQWALALRSAKQIADALAPTMFCPVAFRGKPEEAAAAILAGAEVGLSPRASLNAFDPIQGVAAPKAMTLRAIVQSLGHDIWVVETTAQRAIVRGRRRDSEQVHESVWTMDRARGLGLVGKDNWKKQAGAMLVARATAECCRLTAADAILGIPYAAEELDDGPDTGGPGEQPKARKAQRRVTAVRAAPPPLPEQPHPTTPAAALDAPPLPGEDDDAATGITKAQLTKLHVVLGELGITERADKLTTCGLLLKRQLETSTEITKDEASRLIDQLERVKDSAEPERELDAVLAAAEMESSQDDPPAEMTE